MKNKILVLDSGFGGISTLAEMRKLAPMADYVYFGDDGFMPYGDKTESELIQHLEQVIRFFEPNICGVVIACNTATGVAVDALRKIFPFPIVGTEPAIVAASAEKQNVLAVVTPLEARQSKLWRLVCGRRVSVLQEPNLASAIEKHFDMGKSVAELEENGDVCAITKEILKKAEMVEDVGIVLGCTHYVFLKYTKMLCGADVFDGNFGVAKRVLSVFGNQGEGSLEFVFGSGNKKKSQIALRLFEETSGLLSSFGV